MAVNEYYVVCDQASAGLLKEGLPKWPAAKAEEEVLGVKTAKLITVNAETSLRAARLVQQVFPGSVTTKVISVEKAVVEEV